jgi:hypothetical protein
MALKQNLSAETTRFGIAVTDAYVRIQRVDVSKQTVNVSAEVFASEEAAKSGTNAAIDYRFHQVPFALTMAGDNTIAWAYTQLKTLPEYADATDA